MVDEPLSGAMEGLDVLLFDCLAWNESHLRLLYSDADGFCVIAVVLLGFHEWLHVLGADHLHLVAKTFELSLPVESASAGFDADQARWELRDRGEQIVTAHPFAIHTLSGLIDSE
jgi:hypothetical protein